MPEVSQLRFPAARIQQRFITQLAPVLAMAMLVADLSGRVKVLDEAERATGKRPRPRIGFSFEESLALPVEPLEPREALSFFRQRLSMTKQAWERLEARYRHLAFFVANVESVGVIEQVQKAMDRAMATGATRDTFVAEANRLLNAAGVTPLSQHHLETIFSTNVNTAYATGRHHQQLQADVRRALPWWVYRTVGDSRVRPAHRAMHGFIARWDDKIWSKWYPPAGHRCRCSVFAISEAEARRRAGQSKQDLSIAGSKRVRVEPDEGFEKGPWQALRERLEEGR